jgi:hypothetical protein
MALQVGSLHATAVTLVRAPTPSLKPFVRCARRALAVPSHQGCVCGGEGHLGLFFRLSPNAFFRLSPNTFLIEREGARCQRAGLEEVVSARRTWEVEADAKAAHHVRAVSKQLEALAGRQDSACVDLERKLQRRIQVMIRTESVMPVNVG